MMTDFFRPTMEAHDLKQCSALALAHMGDSVYELMTRGYLIQSGLVTSRNLHRETIHLVCAGAQAAGAQAILPLLTEDEQAVFRHGRNAKPKSIPKSSSPGEYALATAVEALFGWLYLQGEYDRINALFAVLLPAAQQWAKQHKKG
ncbi:MAG: ribonuclease III domain-containing protein [Eubacteriales bacterium]|nr:ribonuclease III domain-containing protein [Eubacteriales bacterium]